MSFQSLHIENWQQFSNVDITFHPNLTIITGANGSGKTTILTLLARHYGWDHISLATPKADKATGLIKFFSRFGFFTDKHDDRVIGRICYEGGSEAKLVVPEAGTAAQYQVQIQSQQAVSCFYIPSHRQTFSYRRITQINMGKKDKQAAFSEVSQSHRNKYNGGHTEPSSFFMKGTILGWIINGYGVRSPTKIVMPADDEQIQHFEGFRDVLRVILPPTLGFEDIEVRDSELVFLCNGGRDEFLFETASGGISALIDMAWQIYMYPSKEMISYTVVIDEIENHLHPTLQRTLLSSLLKAFPRARFIVSTHSPLIVTSVRDAEVCVLRYNDQKRVESTRLNLKNQVKTAIDVLDEVLGVATTIPPWAEASLKEIVDKFASSDLDTQSLAALRIELKGVGLERFMVSAIENIAERGAQ